MTYQGRYAVYWAIRALVEEAAPSPCEILMPSYHHGVEVEAVWAAGAQVKFYPITKNMGTDPNRIEDLVTPNTRAVVIIHHLGFPAAPVEVAQLCKAKNLVLVEDCAHALLSRFEGRPLGDYGNIACFSLHKPLPVPDGGILLFKNVEDVERYLPLPVRPSPMGTTMHLVGMLLGARGTEECEYLPEEQGNGTEDAADVPTSQPRHQSGPKSLMAGKQWMLDAGRRLANVVGMRPPPIANETFDAKYANTRASWVTEALCRGLDTAKVSYIRHRNYQMLTNFLKPHIIPIHNKIPHGVSPLFFPLPVKNKDAALRFLRAQGVAAVDLWRHSHPSLPTGMYPETDWLREHIVELPTHQDLDHNDMERIALAAREAIERG